MKINELFEVSSAGSTLLYHATSLEFIKPILDSNMLRADTDHLISDIYPERRTQYKSKLDYNDRTDTVAGVSLTRDKKFAEAWADVILVFEQNKLKQNYKLKPVSYFTDDATNNRDESEEFVIGPIKNLDRNLVAIYFPPRLEKQYTNYAWVQQNIADVPEEYAGWQAVVSSTKYKGKSVVGKPVQESFVSSSGIIYKNNDLKIKTNDLSNDTTSLDLYDNDKRIGYLVAQQDSDSNYVDIKAAMISFDYKNKGFGKLLYQQLLAHLKPGIKGIRSAIGDRMNAKEIPAIYKSLGGYEQDGYAYIDKLNVTEDIAYHGSDNDFDSFDIRYLGKKTDNGIWGSGFYFTNHTPTAKAYGKNLYKVDLNIKNPLDLTKFKSKEELAEYLNVPESILSKRDRAIGCLLPYSRTFSAAIKEKGHDAVVVGTGGHKEIVVFDPKLININKKESVVEELREDNLSYGDILRRYPNNTIKKDLKSVGEWLGTNPEDLNYEVHLENIDKFSKQINEMIDSYEEFPNDKKRTLKIVNLLKSGNYHALPIFIEKNDDFIMEGRHRIVAFHMLKIKTIPVIYVSKKVQVKEYGRIVPGVNSPLGITPDHTKKMAARFGFNVNQAGYAPEMPTNGKINKKPPKDKDYNSLDKYSLFGVKLDLNKNTDGKSQDIAESVATPTVQVKPGNLYDYDFSLVLNNKNVGQASIEKTTWNGKHAIEVGSIFIEKEFRKLGFGKKLLAAIKSKFQSHNDYVIAECVSMASYKAFKETFGTPIYISSNIADVEEKELTHYLPATAKEDQDGTIDGSSRLYFVFKLKNSIKESLQESKSTPVVVVDIQPEYSGINDGDENDIFTQAITFVNNQTGKVLMLVNAEEHGVSGDTVLGIKEYWEDSGFDPKNWQRVRIYDKGYGYLRSWMDQGISEATIIRTIRLLYQFKTNDSRDIEEETLKKTVGAEWQNWMLDDPIIVNWLQIDTLKQFNHCYLIGGGREECLKEVQLMMNAFNIKYKIINDLVYG